MVMSLEDQFTLAMEAAPKSHPVWTSTRPEDVSLREAVLAAARRQGPGQASEERPARRHRPRTKERRRARGLRQPSNAPESAQASVPDGHDEERQDERHPVSRSASTPVLRRKDAQQRRLRRAPSCPAAVAPRRECPEASAAAPAYWGTRPVRAVHAAGAGRTDLADRLATAPQTRREGPAPHYAGGAGRYNLVQRIARHLDPTSSRGGRAAARPRREAAMRGSWADGTRYAPPWADVALV